jgi:hypothetical protein
MSTQSNKSGWSKRSMKDNPLTRSTRLSNKNKNISKKSDSKKSSSSRSTPSTKSEEKKRTISEAIKVLKSKTSKQSPSSTKLSSLSSTRSSSGSGSGSGSDKYDLMMENVKISKFMDENYNKRLPTYMKRTESIIDPRVKIINRTPNTPDYCEGETREVRLKQLVKKGDSVAFNIHKKYVECRNSESTKDECIAQLRTDTKKLKISNPKLDNQFKLPAKSDPQYEYKLVKFLIGENPEQCNYTMPKFDDNDYQCASKVPTKPTKSSSSSSVSTAPTSTSGIKLAQYQRILSEYMNPVTNPNQRGILAYHSVGSGKTLACVAVIASYLKNSAYNIIFAAPEDSLLNNFKEELKLMDPMEVFGYVPTSEELDDWDEFIAKRILCIKYEQLARRLSLSASNSKGEGISAKWSSATHSFFKTKNRKIREDIYKQYHGTTDVPGIGGIKDNETIIDTNENSLFENSLIVIDEVQNLVAPEESSFTIGKLRIFQSSFLPIFRAITRAKTAKVVLLSATPMKNHPSELALVIDMLKHKDDKTTLYGITNTVDRELANVPYRELYKTNHKYFNVATAEGIGKSVYEQALRYVLKVDTIRDVFHKKFGNDKVFNFGKFKEYIKGLISFIDISVNGSQFAKVNQVNEYVDLDREKHHKLIDTLKKARESDFKNIKNQNNIYDYTCDATGTSCKGQGLISTINLTTTAGEPYSATINNMNSVNRTLEEELDIVSPKIVRLLHNLQKYPKDKHFIYTSNNNIQILLRFILINKGWLEYTATHVSDYDKEKVIEKAIKNTGKQIAILDDCADDKTKTLLNIKKSKNNSADVKRLLKHPEWAVYKKYTNSKLKFNFNNNSGKTFAILDDRTAAEEWRQKVLLGFINDHRNLYGEHIRILIGNAKYKEGITLNGFKHVHMLNPPSNKSIETQIIGRVVRKCAHKYMPKKDWTVRVSNYFLRTPDEPKTNDGASDEKFLNLIQGKHDKYTGKFLRLKKYRIIDQSGNYRKHHSTKTEKHKQEGGGRKKTVKKHINFCEPINKDKCGTLEHCEWNMETDKCDEISADFASQKLANQKHMFLSRVESVVRENAIDCSLYKNVSGDVDCSFKGNVDYNGINLPEIPKDHDYNSNDKFCVNLGSSDCNSSNSCYWENGTQYRNRMKYGFCRPKKVHKDGDFCIPIKNGRRCISNQYCNWDEKIGYLTWRHNKCQLKPEFDIGKLSGDGKIRLNFDPRNNKYIDFKIEKTTKHEIMEIVNKNISNIDGVCKDYSDYKYKDRLTDNRISKFREIIDHNILQFVKVLVRAPRYVRYAEPYIKKLTYKFNDPHYNEILKTSTINQINGLIKTINQVEYPVDTEYYRLNISESDVTTYVNGTKNCDVIFRLNSPFDKMQFYFVATEKTTVSDDKALDMNYVIEQGKRFSKDPKDDNKNKYYTFAREIKYGKVSLLLQITFRIYNYVPSIYNPLYKRGIYYYLNDIEMYVSKKKPIFVEREKINNFMGKIHNTLFGEEADHPPDLDDAKSVPSSQYSSQSISSRSKSKSIKSTRKRLSSEKPQSSSSSIKSSLTETPKSRELSSYEKSFSMSSSSSSSSRLPSRSKAPSRLSSSRLPESIVKSTRKSKSRSTKSIKNSRKSKSKSRSTKSEEPKRLESKKEQSAQHEKQEKQEEQVGGKINVCSYNLSWATQQDIASGSEKEFVKYCLGRYGKKNAKFPLTSCTFNALKKVSTETFDIIGIQEGVKDLTRKFINELHKTTKINYQIIESQHRVAYIHTAFNTAKVGKVEIISPRIFGWSLNKDPNDGRPAQVFYLPKFKTLVINAHYPHYDYTPQIMGMLYEKLLNKLNIGDREINNIISLGDFNDHKGGVLREGFSFNLSGKRHTLRMGNVPKTCCYRGTSIPNPKNYSLYSDYIFSTMNPPANVHLVGENKPEGSDHAPVGATIHL